jgi:plasmid stability protein
MATLYVENVPEDLYEALRRRARENRKSIAAEVISLLERNIPTAAELQSRQRFLKQLERLRSKASPGPGPFPSTEEMQREDREH